MLLHLFRPFFELSLRNQDISSLPPLSLLFLLLALLFGFLNRRWGLYDYFFHFFQPIFTLGLQLLVSFVIDHSQVIGCGLHFLGFLGVDQEAFYLTLLF